MRPLSWFHPQWCLTRQSLLRSDSLPVFTQSKQRPIFMFEMFSFSFRNFSLRFEFRLYWHELHHWIPPHCIVVGSWRDSIRLRMFEMLACRSTFPRGHNWHDRRLLRYCPASWEVLVHGDCSIHISGRQRLFLKTFRRKTLDWAYKGDLSSGARKTCGRTVDWFPSDTGTKCCL